MVCKNCGSYNDDTAKFCIGCGANLAEQQESTNQYTTTQEYAPEATETVEVTPPEAETYDAPAYENAPPVYDNTQPAYQAPPVYQNPPVAPDNLPTPGKGLGIASMVCGIVSFFCAGIILGILAIVFGGVAKSKGYRGGMATAGIVCGAVGLGIYVIVLIIAGSASIIPFM